MAVPDCAKRGDYPGPGEVDERPLHRGHRADICSHITTEPGVYRVEVYIPYRGKRRAWIFSNPIYIY